MAFTSSTALLLTLNILFYTVVSSTYVPCPPPPTKTPGHKPPSKVPKPPTKAPSPGHKHPPPKVPKQPPVNPTCPRDTLKLGACANLLNDIVHLIVGNPPNTPCCQLISGLTDLEAAVCLCTAIKAHVLGINLNVPVSLSLLLNTCGKKVPSGYQCA